MSFASQPTYAEKAAVAPIRVRKRAVTVQAMFFSGGAKQATGIIDWILLNDGVASWTEAYDEYIDAPTEDGQTVSVLDRSVPEHLNVKTPEGVIRAYVGYWIVQGVEGTFHVLSPATFRQNHDHV